MSLESPIDLGIPETPQGVPNPHTYEQLLLIYNALRALQRGIPDETSGPQGVQGAQGADGAQGAQGAQGVTGAQGTQGFQGAVGSQGSQGIAGAQGSVGAQGSTGLQGTQGTQGAVGSQGSTGAQGATGAQGSTGAQGATGSQGVQGATGTQGTQGFQGTTGTQGAQGFQGTQGTQGTQGNQGTQGTQGATPAIGGSTTHVQYNNSGAFAGTSNLTWSGTVLAIGWPTSAAGSPTTTPFAITLGNTYGTNTVGKNFKLKLFEDNSPTNTDTFGLGVSAGLFEFATATTSDFAFYKSAAVTPIELMRLANSGALTIAKNVAIPAGGTAAIGLMLSTTANFGLFFGSGAPTLSAAKGSIYLRSDGSGTTDRAYINTNGSTTWTALTTVA